MWLVKIISQGLLLFFGRVLLWPTFGIIADAIWLGLPLYFKRTPSPQRPLYTILVGSLLIDLISSYQFPLYTITTIIAWYIYSEVIEPRLLFMTSWGRLVSLILWVLLWRLSRLLLVIILWLGQKKFGFELTNLGLASWWEWILGAVIVWLLLEVYNRLRFQRQQSS